MRGLHFQTTPGQAKLLRCSRGSILDVAVDLRRESPTHGRGRRTSFGSRTIGSSLFRLDLPTASASLSEEADVNYKVSSYFDSNTEAGIRWDDPAIGIEWPIAEPLLSERDRTAPLLAEAAGDLTF